MTLYPHVPDFCQTLSAPDWLIRIDKAKVMRFLMQALFRATGEEPGTVCEKQVDVFCSPYPELIRVRDSWLNRLIQWKGVQDEETLHGTADRIRFASGDSATVRIRRTAQQAIYARPMQSMRTHLALNLSRLRVTSI